ncbi:unnamed protein product [Somion occarium]
MNLKAAAQKGGLDAASIGWAILEKLGTEIDHSPEWNEIWNAISVHKATLLLPLEAHAPNESITPEFLRDHIVLCDGASRNNVPIITLSGLRGTLIEETLTIRSTLDPLSKQFQAILNPATRASALTSLPPLPLFTPAIPPEGVSSIPVSPSSSPTSNKTLSGSNVVYPTYILPSHHPSLPLPPRPTAHAASPSKPPLPPRPGVRSSSLTASGTPPHAASRLSNPFASLFGRAATPPPPPSPTTSTTPLQAPSTDASVQPVDASTEQVIGVPAFTMAKRIIHRDLAKNLLRALNTEIRSDLGIAPSWVAERIDDFVAEVGLMPFMKTKSKGKLGKTEDTTPPNAGAGGYVISSGPVSDDGIEGIGQRFQEFYADLEEELTRRKWGPGRSFGRGIVHHLNGGTSSSADSANTSSDEKTADVFDEKEKDPEETAEDQKEKRVREVLEAVERTICSVFYDRLFLQPSSDDASHDEALSSRIAAVNLLDLTLAHLGVEVGNSGTEVEAVVHACGETLTQLDTACRAPADKASILVAAHKIIVDGLSRLPPVRLKSDEDEILDEKTPRAASFGKRRSEADEDAASPEVPRPQIDTKTATLLPDSTEMVTSPDSDFTSTDTVKGLVVDSTTTSSTVVTMARQHSLTVEVPLRTPSPKLTISPAPPTTPTPVSGDIILPLMIFSVVKANPPHLVSHLLYTQRFRNQVIGGEESYCLINLLAVAEFLENVDLAALGLGESEKTVISAAELTPIPLRQAIGSEQSSPRTAQPSLRGRVEQQVDAIAGSANKVISGVVDSSFGVLRSFLPGSEQNATVVSPDTQESAPWNSSRAGFGLLRRDTGFSIASLTASLPGSVGKQKKDEESGQQLVEVPSRPGSSRSIRVGVDDGTSSSEASEDEDEEEESEEEEEEEYDTRSIRSFESMMSSRSGKSRRRKRMAAGPGGVGRKSLTDRLASMPGLSRLSQSTPNDSAKSPPASRRSSLLLPHHQSSGHSTSQNRFDTPISSRGASPVAIRISPPNPRFLECTVDDLKLSEVGELLREYKRLAEAVRAMGGFHDD